ncbi:MAG: Hpt domain-containing protein [Lachnospiraceae bacterium]|nr:Hpt domain-containing protein [Lachnospiraceae bacterium]
MNLKECYAALEGDYEDVIARLRSERLVQKFVLKFLNDPSYDLLNRSLENADYGEAFRAAHTIKGVCQNLSFTKLYHSSQLLTEALRAGWSQEAAQLVPQLTADYQQTISAIRTFQEEMG